MSNNNLAQMGSAQVFIEQFRGAPCIRKQGAGEVEISFYQDAAQHLSGVHSPTLLAVEGDTLFIEHIPHSLTPNELQTTSEVYQQLSHIHRSLYSPNFKVKEHSWSTIDTEAALASLNLPEVTQDSLLHIQKFSDALFNHNTLVSGDTNLGNWGKRDNSQIVLFDWERFGYGSPAIDLAPLVSQMGTLSDYECIVDQYLPHNNLVSREDLIRQLIIAKSWIVVEVTNLLVTRDISDASKYLEWYRKRLPTWLTTVEGQL